jgi:hypothetical protein
MREERDGILVWDDQHKRGEDAWWRENDRGREKIRKLLRVEDNDWDLTGYDLGNKRTLRDYEKYAGIHFEKKSFQKYTKDNFLPPNPVIKDEAEWEDSFMYAFYHLVNIDNTILDQKDYDFISDHRLKQFLDGTPIHFEKTFLTDKNPYSVVYWGHSKERGWAERQQINLQNG